jgi:methionyl-tRNA formyltransferase
VRTPIHPHETTGQLEARLAVLAAPLTLAVLAQLEAGTAQPVEQDHTRATHAGKLEKADGQIDWTKSAVEVERHVRAMQPWPGPFTILLPAGKPPLRMQVLAVTPTSGSAAVAPGTILAVDPQSFTVQCVDGAVRIECVHPDGKRPMPAAEFLRGRKVTVGDHCG